MEVFVNVLTCPRGFLEVFTGTDGGIDIHESGNTGHERALLFDGEGSGEVCGLGVGSVLSSH